MITTLQVLVSIVLIGLILVQERSSGLSSLFGGSGSTPYQTRRGAEKMIFTATIITSILFLALAVVNLIF